MSASPRRTLPPALLADSTWYGTLAAVRDLGSRGVPVTLAADSLVAPARWSRHLDRAVRCPTVREPARYLEWLLAFGEREPGHVLYPTSDDTAWLVATHRAALSRHYRLFTPEPDGLLRLLDKSLLGAEARAAGLDVPEARFPSDEEEAEAMALELGFPLYVKPRTQVMLGYLGPGRKGVRVDRLQDLRASWRSLREVLIFDPLVSRHAAGIDLPMLQAAHVVRELVYTVDGFVDGTGQEFVALACAKLLQQPRRSGPGLCFESQPLAPGIADGLRRLCMAVGFRGVFDAEFLVEGERRLLIDFNPRFYNHMAFEVVRGLPLPWLAYLAAQGDAEGLRAEVARARAAADAQAATPVAYVHRLPTGLLMAAQRLTGAMDEERRRQMKRWLAANAGRSVDPARDPGDPLPGAVEVLMHVRDLLRHPRGYLRALALDAGAPAHSPRPADTVDDAQRRGARNLTGS